MQEIRIVSVDNKVQATRMLRVINIKVKDKVEFDNLKYIEMVQFTLLPCTEHGVVLPKDKENKVVIVFKIVTGFMLNLFVENHLRNGFKDFNIFNLNAAIKAFYWRDFYDEHNYESQKE